MGGYPDEVLFKKLTVIYGSNGSGKTTLAAICRSMTSGDPGGIVKRKSAIQYSPNSTAFTAADTSNKTVSTLPSSQSIEILDYDGTVYKYEKEKWSKIHPNIQIFDSHFCQKFFASPKPPLNLCSGDRFTMLRNETKASILQNWNVSENKSVEATPIQLSDEIIQEQKKKVEGESICLATNRAASLISNNVSIVLDCLKTEETIMNEFLLEYQQRVNDYLQKFCADFQLQNLRVNPVKLTLKQVIFDF
ncbi:unnamed protein product [Rotaria sp. Silwood2]|nr:unnamed protein product [Rotaria sp. Silwood2]CAF4832500.1 unnamed protein product [Rotaria sp. Silwood2]